MTLATSIAQIRGAPGGPCAAGYRHALSKLPKDTPITAEIARANGVSLQDISWYLSGQANSDPEIGSRLQHWKADCATRVLHVFEAIYPLDCRVRNAIIAAHAEASGGVFAQGCITGALAAEEQAWTDENIRAAQAAAAARTCGDLSRPAWECTDSAVSAVRENAVAELAWQFDRLIEWFSENPPEPLPLGAGA